MDRRLALALLLVIAALLAGAAGWQRLQALQPLVAESGPQALARDGRGGVFLATATQLLQLDASGNVLARHAARDLGLGRLQALAQGEAATLWVLDSEHQRIARCDTRAWRCPLVTPPGIQLGEGGIVWQFGPERRLLVSDRAQGRLLAFAEDGTPLPLPGHAWREPGALARGEGQLLMAERRLHRVVALDGIANQPLATVLNTQAPPQAFVQRDAHWWVLEGAPAQLRHYHAGRVLDLPLPAADAVALLDAGHVLLIASRGDGALLALDPEFDTLVPFASPALRELLATQARDRVAAQRELRWLQPGLAATVALLLLPVPWLLWRWRRARHPASERPMTVVALSAAPAPMAAPAFAVPPPADPAPAADNAAESPRRVARIAALQGDRHLVCGPDKLVLVEAGKPVLAVPYDAVWLGGRSLLLGQHRLRLHFGLGRPRPAWDLAALQSHLLPRLPAGHQLGEFALARRLLARGQPQGLLVLLQALPYPLALPVILLLLIECGRLLAQGVLHLPPP